MIKGIAYFRAKARAKRRQHIRKHLHGSVERPRLCVYRSNKHIYAQIIDDNAGITLVSYSDKAKDFQREAGKKPIEISFAVGVALGKKAKDAGIEKVSFDRGGFLYHGRVKALADGARQAGLDF